MENHSKTEIFSYSLAEKNSVLIVSFIGKLTLENGEALERCEK